METAVTDSPARSTVACGETTRCDRIELTVALFITTLSVVGYCYYYGTPNPTPRATFPVLLLTTPLLAVCLLGGLTLGCRQVVQFWQRVVDAKPEAIWYFPAGLFAAYLLYAVPTGLFKPIEAAGLAAYLMVPTALGLVKRLWADWAFALALFIPIQLKLLHVPRMPLSNGVQLDILFATVLAFWILMVVRRLEGFRFQLSIPADDVKFALRLFALFGVIAVPLGMVTGFLVWRPFSLPLPVGIGPWVYLALPVAIYLIVALPEEALFRGLVQNLLGRTFHSVVVGLILASVVFGIVHKKGSAPEWYQWNYAVFAAIAGLFYGYAYLKTGRLTAAAVLHSLVDWAWLTFFNPRGS